MEAPLFNYNTKRFNLTEFKKAEIDALSIKVLDVQHRRDYHRIIVNSLNEKVNHLQNYLTLTKTRLEQAKNNKTAFDKLYIDAQDLETHSAIGFQEVKDAQNQSQNLAIKLPDVLSKLIYSSEVINKLANTIIRKKALNPLISDDLVSQVSKAGTNANNAIALMLVALQSSYAAQASSVESKNTIELALQQTTNLVQNLSEDETNAKASPTSAVAITEKTRISLKMSLYEVYHSAESDYKAVEHTLDKARTELYKAQKALQQSEIELNTLQTGLAAATAAALAS